MTPARGVYGRIEAGIAEIRREETRLAEQIPALAEEAAEIRRAEVEILRALAAMRLDALQRDEATGRLDAAESAALAALDESRERLAEIEGRRSRVAEELELAEATRAAAEEAAEAADEALERQAETTEARLGDDVAWQAATERAATAAARAEAADRKAERAEADRAEKSAAYDGDPLFRYLWERSFGTAAYRASNLVRYLDGRVARLIGYAGARADYHRLTEIPARLREHADRLAAEAREAQAALTALERAALEADGIAALETALAERTAELEAAEAEIDRLEGEHAGLDAEAARLTSAEEDGALSGALARLARDIGAQSLAELAARTAGTDDPEDDRLVAQLAAVRADSAEADRALRQAEAERAELAERRARLEEDRRRFRENRYDRSGGGFDNSDMIGELIGGIVRGAIQGGLADALSSGYRGPKRRSRSSFGGGLTRPARRGGGGGGFRTGGGF